MPSFSNTKLKLFIPALLFVATYFGYKNVAEEVTQSRSLTTAYEIPKLVHYMLLGNDAPEYMVEMVNVNMERLRSMGYESKLWRDEDAERLVAKFNDPLVSQSWEWVKADERGSRLAKLADFLRPLILFMEGGIYLDTDMVPCGPMDYMIDDPEVVSFPHYHADCNQVNGAEMSSRPGHPLMKMAVESFIALGPDITWMHNLDAAGPRKMAKVTDEYLQKKFDIPPLFSSYDYNAYVDAPEVTMRINDWWAQIGDVRFASPVHRGMPTTHHLGAGSWIKNYSHGGSCSEHPEVTKGFVEWMCEPHRRHHGIRYEHCANYLEEISK